MDGMRRRAPRMATDPRRSESNYEKAQKARKAFSDSGLETAGYRTPGSLA